MISSAARTLFQTRKIHMNALSEEQLMDELETCVKGTPWHAQLDREVTRRLREVEQDVLQAMYA